MIRCTFDLPRYSARTSYSRIYCSYKDTQFRLLYSLQEMHFRIGNVKISKGNTFEGFTLLQDNLKLFRESGKFSSPLNTCILYKL